MGARVCFDPQWPSFESANGLFRKVSNIAHYVGCQTCQHPPSPPAIGSYR
jgi:hypothetical protein